MSRLTSTAPSVSVLRPPDVAAGCRRGALADADGGHPLRQFARRLCSSVIPRRRMLIRGPANSAEVCLTFDDGPDPRTTPMILDELRARRIPATFFVVGNKARRHPELVMRIVEEGHRLANHSWSHREPADVSPRRLFAEVRRTHAYLQRMTGASTSWFRPPKGQLTINKALCLWNLRQTIVLWNRDPRDYRLQNSEQLLDWFTSQPLNGGDILLLHDNQQVTADGLPGVLRAIERQGLRCVTPDRWISGRKEC